MRKKAWERRLERGFSTRIAQHLTDKGLVTSAQTVRRWLLEPEHPDRRACSDPEIRRILARRFDLQPNDYEWLHGEKAQRRAAQRRELEARTS